MFDDSRLDDPDALASADERLRYLADAGARVRREDAAAGPAIANALDLLGGARPRAVVAAGPDSRLLRAVLEPWCPVPFVAWPNPRLPGWVGGLDLVVVLAPHGSDRDAASAVAEAVRRGCSLIVAAPAHSVVAEHATGRDVVHIPTESGDQLATAVVVLELLERLTLAPAISPSAVADALDAVAVACSPYRDLVVNPAKNLASGIGDTSPLLWGGSVLAARAARRVAEALRRATGRAALAADAVHLLPVLEQAAAPDVFADPFDDPNDDVRPSLLIFGPEDVYDDDPMARADRTALLAEARRHGVRVETVAPERTPSAKAPGPPSDEPGSSSDESGPSDDVALYAAMLATGQYAAEYLRVALT